MAEKPVPAKALPVVPVKPSAAAKPDIAAKPVAPAIPVAAKAPAKSVPVAKPKPVVPAAAVAAALTHPIPERVAPAFDKGKTPMTETFEQVRETADKFTSEAADRANAAFGDINARAKTAMEKGAKVFEDAVEFNKGNLEAVVASARVAAKGAEDIAKYSAEYGRTAIEKANANAKRFAGVKSPTEFFQLQSEVAKTNLDEIVAQASKFSESYLKLLGDIVQPISNRYAVAAEKVKTTVAA